MSFYIDRIYNDILSNKYLMVNTMRYHVLQHIVRIFNVCYKVKNKVYTLFLCFLYILECSAGYYSTAGSGREPCSKCPVGQYQVHKNSRTIYIYVYAHTHTHIYIYIIYMSWIRTHTHIYIIYMSYLTINTHIYRDFIEIFQ